MKAKTKKLNKEQRERQYVPLANIKVIGIGGGGGNVISRMSRDVVRGVDFAAINTDHQDLDHCDAKKKIYIGRNLTRGLGTGMIPELGRQAAEENRSEIAEALNGADLIFLASCFGGGTGTGATPVVAEVAKQTGALTVAFVTRPFGFEGGQREKIAQEGVSKLRDKVDALIVVPNDRIFTVINKETPIIRAFEIIDDVLKNALQGIVDLIMTPGIINVDFADVRNVIQDAGSAIVGIGLAAGQDRAVAAVNFALNSPLLEVSAEGARGVVLGISGGRDLKMTEINEAAKLVAQTADPSARIIFGAYYDRKLKPNQIKVTLIATGFNSATQGIGHSLFDGGFSLSKKSDFFDPMKPSLEISQPRGDEDGKKGKPEPVLAKKENLAEKGIKPFGSAQDKPEAKKERENDIWDIPTFLRKKKK